VLASRKLDARLEGSNNITRDLDVHRKKCNIERNGMVCISLSRELPEIIGNNSEKTREY